MATLSLCLMAAHTLQASLPVAAPAPALANLNDPESPFGKRLQLVFGKYKSRVPRPAFINVIYLPIDIHSPVDELLSM